MGRKFLGPCSFFCDEGNSAADDQSKSGFGDIDTMGILNDIFEMRENHGSGLFHQGGDIEVEDNGELVNNGHESDSSIDAGMKGY